LHFNYTQHEAVHFFAGWLTVIDKERIFVRSVRHQLLNESPLALCCGIKDKRVLKGHRVVNAAGIFSALALFILQVYIFATFSLVCARVSRKLCRCQRFGGRRRRLRPIAIVQLVRRTNCGHRLTWFRLATADNLHYDSTICSCTRP